MYYQRSLVEASSNSTRVPGACETTDGDDSENSSLWIIGVFLAIFASAMSNLGVNVQKLSQNKEKELVQNDEAVKARPYVMQPIWLAGLAMVVLGSLGDFIALGFAAQSLIIPVGGSTMIFNVGFAHFWLHEELSRRDLFATGLLICGVLVITLFAPKDEQCFTASELVDLYWEPLFIVYTVFFLICFSTLYVVGARLSKRRSLYGAADPRYSQYVKMHRFVYPCMSGLVGAQDVLFAKSTAELIKSSLNGENQFAHFITYAVIILMVVCILMQLHFLALGLQNFDAVYVVPLFQCFFISGSIISGAIYFKEFQRLSADQLFGFGLGAVTILLGVYFLSLRKAASEDLEKKYKGDPKRRFRSAVFAIIYVLRWKKERGGTEKTLVEAMQRAWAYEVIRNGLNPFDPQYASMGIPLPRVLIRKRREVNLDSFGSEYISLKSESEQNRQEESDKWVVADHGPDAAAGAVSPKSRLRAVERKRSKLTRHLPWHSRILLWLTHKLLQTAGRLLGYNHNAVNADPAYSLGSTSFVNNKVRPSPFLRRSGGLLVLPDFGTGVLAMAGDASTGTGYFAPGRKWRNAFDNSRIRQGNNDAEYNRRDDDDDESSRRDFFSALGHGPGPGWGWLASQLLRERRQNNSEIEEKIDTRTITLVETPEKPVDSEDVEKGEIKLNVNEDKEEKSQVESKGNSSMRNSLVATAMKKSVEAARDLLQTRTSIATPIAESRVQETTPVGDSQRHKDVTAMVTEESSGIIEPDDDELKIEKGDV
eukprot:g5292.t1